MGLRKAFILLILAGMGLMLYGQRDRQHEGRQAFRTFEQRALSGDAEAQYRLATILEKGWDSIAPDSTRALGLMRASANARFAPAMNYMGYLYGVGYRVNGRQLVAANPDSARYWLRLSADMGDPRAMSNLAYLLLNPDSLTIRSRNREHDDSLAFRYLSRAAEQQAPTAMSMLGDLYRDGRAVNADTLKAASLYEGAASRGLPDAQLRLISLMGSRWEKLPADSALRLGLKYYTTYAPAAGVVLFEHASTASNSTDIAPDTIPLASDSPTLSSANPQARAFALLGNAFSRGNGVKYDHDKSLACYARAAREGNPSAMYVLAETLDMFPDALSDIVTLKSSEEWLADPRELRRKAASAGITDAASANRALFTL